MSYEGTRLGDITLCKHCNRAIRLERWATFGDVWMHFTANIFRTHRAEPKVAFTSFEHWLESR